MERGGPRVGWEGLPLLAFAGACALSPLFFGFYDMSVWGPLALVVLVVLVAAATSRGSAPAPRALVALGALVALAAWAWLSRGWAESADAALTEANRWALYAAVLGALCLLVRNRRHATLLLGALAVGVLGIALYVIARMTFGSGAEMFLGGRLNDPLGYVNGQAGFFLLGLWPLVALAEHERPAPAAAGAAGAALLAGLLVLSQSRGVALAAATATAFAVLVVPGRARRLWALLAVAVPLLLSLPLLLDVYDAGVGSSTPPPDDVVRDAALALLLAAAGTGLAWGVARAAVRDVSGRGPVAAARLRTASAWGLGLVAALVLLAGLSQADRIADRARVQYDAFVQLEARRGGGSRFLSGGGNRYDYWRIAWREFRAQPGRGLGAGNYDRDYFRLRRTLEDVRQPHSLLLQALSELGLVGAAILAAFAAAVLAGLLGLLRRARDDLWARGAAVGAGGAFVAWLAHTDVDWLHLLPGVTGIALGAAVVLLRPWEGERPVARRGVRAGALAALGIAAAVAAVTVARPVWAEHLRTQARQALPEDPVQALEKSADALALNPDAVPAYYVKSAAYARLDDYPQARDALLEAAEREPSDYVTWALLGDLAVRRGERAQAVRWYRRAAALNPRDADLARQAREAARPR